MTLRIESPRNERALAEFVRFHDRVHAGHAARWPAFVSFEVAVLAAESPYLEGRKIRALVARENGEVVARAAAVIDERYREHWREPLGHLVMFDALPGSGTATRALVDAACEWFADQGTEAVRAGYGMLDLPFVIDDYDSLPPSILRQNPPYYHALLKSAGFETEKGWVDFRIEVRADIVARWESALEAVRRAGIDIRPLRDCARDRRSSDLADTWNDAFGGHWGHTPSSRGEFEFLLGALEPAGILDTTVLAFDAGRPIGVVWAMPSGAAAAVLAPGRRLADHEKLNILAIGLREPARGRGIGQAMAASTYLELVRRGARYVSYTLVLDDNWPSRRTAERLGAEIRANYVTYRRNLRR